MNNTAQKINAPFIALRTVILLWAACLLTTPVSAGPLQALYLTPIKADEEVILFTTHAYRDKTNKHWIAPIHGWIFEPEYDSSWRGASLSILAKLLKLDNSVLEKPLFLQRARMFIVDNQRHKTLQLTIGKQIISSNNSAANGHFKVKMPINPDTVHNLPALDITVNMPVNDSRTFRGKVLFPDPQGLAVISDIDDTVKISQVRDKKRLIENTFLKPFLAVPGMAPLYTHWQKEGASFHYVSSSPWQLYPALEKFFANAGLPEGSFHLKTFRLKDQSFLSLFASPMQSKIPTIASIIEKYPQQDFILVGDSGEKDPEVYAEIYHRYPNQIRHIYIRNVSGETKLASRYQQTFKGLDPNDWTVFTNPRSLREALSRL